MRHIADGDLHAYLDGELEFYPPDEAEWIRDHLEGCASCRSCLDEARTTREDASTVLAGAGSGPVEAPPLEELRRRALASRRSGEAASASGWNRGGMLRVAATAVVALGVGWMVGRTGAAPSPGADAPAAETTRSVAAVPDDRAPAAPVVGTAGATGVTEHDPSGEESDGSIAAAPDDRIPRVAQETRQSREARSPGEDRPAAALDELIDSLQGAFPRGAAALSTDAHPVARSGEAPAEEYRRRTGGDGQLEGRSAAGLTLRSSPALPARRQAADDTDRRLTVPGLAVVSVEWTEVAPGIDGPRVVQELVTGDTIELRFGGLDGSEASPDALLRESLPDGVRQVMMPFENGWVVARARLDEDRLRALLALLS